jgi:hypothetical protein
VAFRTILKALTQPLSAIVLGVALGFLLINQWVSLIFCVLLVFLTLKKLRDPEFIKKLELEENVYSIKRLDRECERLSESPKNSTNIEKRTIVREILKVKNEIMSSFLSDSSSSLKQRITKQAITLIVEYLHLIENYYLRFGNIDDKRFEQIQNRIDENKKKLNMPENEHNTELVDTIEMDERLLLNAKAEKEELDKINSKINYIESSIQLFNQQIKDDIHLEESSENADSIINEAIALDNVINLKNREKDRA